MLNKQLLIGHVGEDPECGQLTDGNNWARFRVATTERSFTTSRGQQVPERTTWHNIECWGGLARVIAENVHKGDKLYIEGIHHTREYTNKDGRQDTWHSCDATYIEFLSVKKVEQPTTEVVAPAPAPAKTKPNKQAPQEQAAGKNDLPF